MKIPISLTLTIALATTLAFIAPLAAAAGRSTLRAGRSPTTHPAAKGLSVAKNHTASRTARPASGSGVYVAPFGPDPIITPRYIYIPGFAPDPNATISYDDCAVSGNNCTGDQLCELWGQC